MVKSKEKITNASVIGGEEGELFVTRNIRCPRCNYKLKKLPPGTPGVDFCCTGRDRHWFQLKSRMDTYIKIRNCGELNLSCGQFEQQQIAFDKQKADVLLLLYNRNRHIVRSLYLYRNEHILYNDLQLVIRKTNIFSRKTGVQKRITGTVNRRLSKLCVRNCHLSPISIGKNNRLPLDLVYDVRKRIKIMTKLKSPELIYEISGYKCSLNNETCTCDVNECEHLITAWSQYLENPNHRKHKGSTGLYYAVDVDNCTCSCPHYMRGKNIMMCKHLRDASLIDAIY